MSIMSVVFSNVHDQKLNELTLHRTMGSVPYGGRYRLIDFVLSNLVNAGVDKIGIITKHNYRSLIDHLGMGKHWDLNRQSGGLFVFPPFDSSGSQNLYRGKVEALYGVLDFFIKSNEEYVLLSDCNTVMSIDFLALRDYHIKNGADITIVSAHKKLDSQRLIINSDDNHLINDVLISQTKADKEENVSLNTFFIKRELLIELIRDAYEHNEMDFAKDIIQKKSVALKMYSYLFDGYVAVIDSISSYFLHSMELLCSEVRSELFNSNGKILTKVKSSVPTLYRDTAMVKNSLVADSCVISGTVENSILFRGVKVESGAVIKNSIVMQDSCIMKNAQLNYVIADKGVNIKEYRMMAGYETYPVVIAKDSEV